MQQLLRYVNTEGAVKTATKTPLITRAKQSRGVPWGNSHKNQGSGYVVFGCVIFGR